MVKTRRKYLIAIVIVLSVIAGFIVYQWWPRGPRAGSVLDEAIAHLRVGQDGSDVLEKPEHWIA